MPTIPAILRILTILTILLLCEQRDSVCPLEHVHVCVCVGENVCASITINRIFNGAPELNDVIGACATV